MPSPREGEPSYFTEKRENIKKRLAMEEELKQLANDFHKSMASELNKSMADSGTKKGAARTKKVSRFLTLWVEYGKQLAFV